MKSSEARRAAPGTAYLGFARLDLDRKERQGVPEVVYGEGKSAAKIVSILKALKSAGQEPLIVTRLDAEKAEECAKAFGDEFFYSGEARFGRVGKCASAEGTCGRIAVACGGTSDLPVAEEAALTAEALGNEVVRLYDIGVAALHRIAQCEDELRSASVVVAVAGMEGALASVIGGLVRSPVVAVPTSVGYGASFGGLAALLAMLNSCAAGVCTVNIDNGFGAGFLASRINHMRERT